ncbi:unnamed protein product [Caenorhabditis brenneri]
MLIMQDFDDTTTCEYRGKTYNFIEFLPRVTKQMACHQNKDGKLVFVDREKVRLNKLAEKIAELAKAEKK